MENLIKELFVDRKLEVWANVLEVVGFLITIITLIIGLFIRSQINQLKTTYIFDKRIKDQLKNLQTSATSLNNHLNNYNSNLHAIKTELAVCQTELEDLVLKLNFNQSRKIKGLIKFIRKRRKQPLVPQGNTQPPIISFFTNRPKRLYKTTYNDIWIIYDSLIEVIRHVENIKKNKDKAL